MAPNGNYYDDLLKKKLDEKNPEHFLKLLQTQEGALFFWAFFDQVGMFQSSFTGNSTTFYREGWKDAGRWVFGRLNRMGILDDMRQKYIEQLAFVNEIVRKEMEDMQNGE